METREGCIYVTEAVGGCPAKMCSRSKYAVDKADRPPERRLNKKKRRSQPAHYLQRDKRRAPKAGPYAERADAQALAILQICGRRFSVGGARYFFSRFT